MTARTPGAIAYAAYWQVHQHDGHIHRPPPFAQLPTITRASWEAAAEAVRGAVQVELAAAWQEAARLRQEETP